MFLRLSRLAVLAGCFCATATLAGAAPITWLGSDHGLEGATSTPEEAYEAFTSGLDGLGVEDFEGYGNGDTGFDLDFGNGIAASVSGTEVEADSVAGAGRFATSGNTFFETEGAGGFTLSFDSEINAFGFYGTDIGDFGNILFLTLLGESGPVTLDIVSLFDVTTGIDDGGLLFFGFHDPDQAYTGIEFGFADGPVDRFGIDDAMAGRVSTPNTRQEDNSSGDTVKASDDDNEIVSTPLPAAGALILGGVAALVGFRRINRRG